MEHVDHISEALKLLNGGGDGVVTLTLAKSAPASAFLAGGPLSSSSSGNVPHVSLKGTAEAFAVQIFPQ